MLRCRCLILLACCTSVAQNAPKDWVVGPWSRASQEPVIRPEPRSTFLDPVTRTEVHWEALHTFNPAAIVKDGKIVVLYRAEDNSGEQKIGGHTSRLGLATSDDGVHFTRLPEPVFSPGPDGEAQREADGGTEDPRLVQAPDGRYVLTYTQWSRRTHIFTVGIATSTDLRHWQKFGPAFGTSGKYAGWKYKSAAIVTELRDGKLLAARLHGCFWMYWGEGEVHLASSEDLVHWVPVEDNSGVPLVLLRKRKGLSDSAFPETGAPALLTRRGVVLLYDAKNATSPDERDHAIGPGAYTVQEALFAPDDPGKLLDRTERPVLAPALPWEKSGQYVAGTTFGEGLVFFHGKWWLYYGSADSFVGVASSDWSAD